MIAYQDSYEFHKDTLVWLQYVDPTKLRSVLDDIFAEYDIGYVTPNQGNPITGDDLEL